MWTWPKAAELWNKEHWQIIKRLEHPEASTGKLSVYLEQMSWWRWDVLQTLHLHQDDFLTEAESDHEMTDDKEEDAFNEVTYRLSQDVGRRL